MINPVPDSPGSEQLDITWGQRRTLALLRRTQRRVLRIEVRPSGDVFVFAPVGEDIGVIQARVRRKCPWIFREIDRVANRPSVTPERHFVSGETYLLLGRRYRLAIEQSEIPEVHIQGDRLAVLSPKIDDATCVRRLLTNFYTTIARNVLRDRLDIVVAPFVRRGLQRPFLVVRRMTKRWGSFTSRGRIVLNVDLVRASPMLIDYVICHELAHAFHPDHGKDWRNLLNTVMPDWEDRKARLEAFLR